MAIRSRPGLARPWAAWRALREHSALLALAVLVAGCGAAGSPALSTSTPAALDLVAVDVSPTSATVAAGGVPVSFRATVANGASSGVTWEVDGVVGGNATAGTISTSGEYLSPGTLPSPATVTITAISVADSTRSASATVTLTASTPALSPQVSITPSSATAQAGLGLVPFTAKVSNSASSAITWQVNGIVGGNSTLGTITATGVYAAPYSVPAPPAVTVSAVLTAEPTQSATATVTVTAPVTVQVMPTSASVRAGVATQAFAAAISNADTANVTWEVNGVAGGNVSVGTITAWGLYTAPAVAPTPATVTVSALSNADPTRSASAAVTIVPAGSVAVTISPASASLQAGLGSQAFTATVSNSSSTAVSWQVNGISGGNSTVGTISSTGLYQAPQNQPSPSAVTVAAVLIADPTRSGAAPVMITPPVTVAVAPASAAVTVATGSQAFTASVQYTASNGVLWQVNGITGGNATVGTISPGGLYMAPAKVPAPASVTVTAVSTADPTRAGSATVTVTATGAVSISISPTLASVGAGSGTEAFSVQVVNGATGAVTWQVNGAPGGNAKVGTVSAGGLYTAPAAPPTPATVSVTAVSVDDPTKSASASVTVVLKSGSPTISGAPQSSAYAGLNYAFQPSATSPAGLPLTFQIANKPDWATFNASSGLLSGTPTAASIGSYANITVSVSDGSNSATLPAFTITVLAGGSGQATLSWTPPTTRTDGSALTNLAGYRIYYGTTPGSYPNVITVSNPGLATYVVSNLPAGTYYFVATAIDASGVESAYSNTGSKTIGNN